MQEDVSAFLLKQTLSGCCQILFKALETIKRHFLFMNIQKMILSNLLFFFLTTREWHYLTKEKIQTLLMPGNVYIVIYFLFIYFGVTEVRSLKGGGVAE